MHIIAQCPSCGKGWLLEEDAVDCRVRCRHCGLLFKIPSLEQIHEAVEIIGEAKGEIYVDQDGKTYG